MRLACSFALLLIGLSCGGFIRVGDASSHHNVVGATEADGIRLTTEVLEARFCASDYLRLKLKLRYFNSASKPVILYRHSGNILTYFISRSADEAGRGKHEQKYTPSQSRVSPPEPVDNNIPDDRKFVILNPGSSFDVVTQADLPFLFDGKQNDPDLLRPGSHVLKIRTRTWYESQELGAKLRDRWRNHGYLWTDSVISEAMTFEIAKDPLVVQCSN